MVSRADVVKKTPQYGYAKREKHRLGKEPCEAQIVASVARDNFTHKQSVQHAQLDFQ
ncbi:phosphoribosylpyrophosphate synthetase [Paraburkholderia sp. RAU6.4a]